MSCDTLSAGGRNLVATAALVVRIEVLERVHIKRAASEVGTRETALAHHSLDVEGGW